MYCLHQMQKAGNIMNVVILKALRISSLGRLLPGSSSAISIAKKNSHITAASTPKENLYGYIFNDCVLTADTSLSKVSLGRPWRPYSSVVYINTYIDNHILPQGWDNWRNTANEKTARYAEYNSYGPGANPKARFAWAGQLTEQEAEKITLDRVFPSWNPKLQ